MKIEFERKTKKIAKAYFIEDYEIRDEVEKPFYMVITPLEQEFYYLEKLDKGYKITGEGWIIYDKNEALNFVNKKRLEIDNKNDLYFINIDKNGNVLD